MAEQHPESASRSLLATMFDWWRDYRARREGIQEINQLDRNDIEATARDIGVSGNAIPELASRGPRAADEAAGIMRQIGLDPDAVVRADAAVMKDMQRTCSSCGNKGTCHHHLDHGTAGAHYHDYCGNAATIDALRPEAAQKTR